MLDLPVVFHSVTPWTVACWAILSVEFFRQEYWSGLPFPTSRDLPNPGVKPTSLEFLHWQADSLSLCHLGGINHKYACISSLLGLPPILLGHRRAPGWAPCATQQLPTSPHFTPVVYVCWSYSLNLSHPLLPLLLPQVHSLHLYVSSCPANRFIITIFLNSVYTR